MTEVHLSKIHNPGNLRALGDVTDLAASIAELGLLQPLVVSADGNGGYLLIAGQHRYAALEKIGYKEIPASWIHVVEQNGGSPDEYRLVVQLVENLQRRDLDPVEEAQGYSQLKALGWKQTDIARRLGRSQAVISKRLNLLRLPDDALDLHASGRIGVESLYELTKVVDAGGDLAQIIDALAENNPDEAYPADEITQMVKIATAESVGLKLIADRVAELEAAGVAVLAPVRDLWGDLRKVHNVQELRWDFDLDPDAHAKQPCHAVCVYPLNGTPRESYHCTDTARHGPQGDSKLKLKAKSTQSNRESAQRKAHKALTASMLASAAAVLDGRPPARDKVIARAIEMFIDRLGSDTKKRVETFLGASIDGHRGWGLLDLYQSTPSADQPRILLAIVLAESHGQTSSYWTTDDGREPHLRFLEDLGQPVDRVEVHKAEKGVAGT